MVVPRKTRQQDVIAHRLLQAGRPVSIEELHRMVRRVLPTLGIATVYRAIKRGLEGGTLREVPLHGEPSRYEPAGLPHHHHFNCRSCHKVFDIHACPGSRLLRALTPRGYRLESHDLVLHGQCPSCAGASAT
ncbi:MAG: transcriptional repressor [Phycisphaera sp.]|nr:transcriptional repressor [Phycisphaera sp.]